MRVALLIGVAALSATANEWRDDALPTSFRRLTSACVLAPDLGWSGGRDGLLLRWDGSTWSRQNARIRGDIVAMDAPDADTLWIAAYDIGTQASTLHRICAGDTLVIDVPYGVRATAMVTDARGTVWVFGRGGRIVAYDGRSWKETQSPGYRTPLSAARGEGASVRAVGEFGTIWLWDGERWLAEPSPVEAHLNAVTQGDSSWIAGDGGTILRRRGGVWEQVAYDGGEHLYGAARDQRGGVWLCGSDALLRWDGSEVTHGAESVHGVLRAIAFADDGSGWALGFGAALHRRADPDDASSASGRPLGFYRQELLANVLGVQGVAFGDVNLDGLDDLYLVCARDANHLLMNDDLGQFVDVTGFVGLMGAVATNPVLHQLTQYSATWADLTNDGRLDLVVAGWHGSTNLFRQERDGSFENITDRLPLDEGPLSINCITVADVDVDGWLDMFATNEHGSNRLWMNNTRGHWVDETGARGLASRGGSKQAVFGDLDDDGDPDLYVCNWHARNSVYRNDDGVFVDVSATCVASGDTAQSNGATLGDLDNDGDMDIVVSRTTGQNSIYRNDGDWTFEEVGGIVSFASGPNSHGSAAQDFDNDGDLDLVIVNNEGVNYFENAGDLTFVSTVIDGLTDIRDARAVAVADIDRDGDCDLFVGSRADLVDRVTDFRRRRSSCFINKLDDGAAILVDARQSGGNERAVGGRVILWRDDDGYGTRVLAGSRELASGTGYLSQNSLTAHFGVQPGASYTVEVRFPGGGLAERSGLHAGDFVVVRDGVGVVAWLSTAAVTTWTWLWSDLVRSHVWPLAVVIPLLVVAVRTTAQRFVWTPVWTAIYAIALCTVYALIVAVTAPALTLLERLVPAIVSFGMAGVVLGLSFWSGDRASSRLARRRQIDALAERADLSGVLSSSLETRELAELGIRQLELLFPVQDAAICLYSADGRAVDTIVPPGGMGGLTPGNELPDSLARMPSGEAVVWDACDEHPVYGDGLAPLRVPLYTRDIAVGVVCASVPEREVDHINESSSSLKGFAGLLAMSLYNAQLQRRAREHDTAYREWLGRQARPRPASVNADALHREITRRLGMQRRRAAPVRVDRDDLVGDSPAFEEVRDNVRQVAASESTVLLTGESGSGKELVARAIHRQSGRSDGPFVALNCGAIPEGLLESELFGHTRGAFTGASADRVGVFERANGGTIFLDEIAEMNPAAQVRLLRVLQERTVTPVGGDGEIALDVRVIAATLRDLSGAVASGAFREDLFYRLNVFPIAIPPLRQRLDDLPALVAELLTRISNRSGTPTSGLTADAVERLLEHDWPGNVRELENVLERASLIAEGGLISEEHIAFGTREKPLRSDLENGDDNLVGKRLPELERELIEQTLRACGNNVSETARRLGVTRDILRYRMKKYDIGRVD